MSPVVISAAEVPRYIPDGATVGLDGFTMMGVADELYEAIEHSFLTDGTPRDLVVVHSSGQSNREVGLERFAHEGLIRRIVGSHWGLAPRLGSLIADDGVEGVCLPQGQISTLLRAIAAGRPGNLSSVGINTFVDPRIDGGRVNGRARAVLASDAYVDLVHLEGRRDYLLYRSFPIDVAIFRASRADRSGNAAQDDEASGLDALSLAQAVRNSGGIVICQVRELVEDGEIPARDVTVPGNLIDFLVPTSDAARFHRQSDSFVSQPELVGAGSRGAAAFIDTAPPPPERMLIGMRGAALAKEGDVINVGTGIPGDTIGLALARRGILDRVTLSIESGVYGGVPLGGTDFGAAVGPTAIISHAAQFDFYNGGGVDIAYMGVGQLSREGNVNVSSLGGRVIGCGGFIDILDGARRICFLASSRGQHRKFVAEVDHLTFNGREALAKGQQIYLATEDVTLRLHADGWSINDSDDVPELGAFPSEWLAPARV